MGAGNGFGAGQVGDGARDAKHPVVAACGDMKPLTGFNQQPPSVSIGRSDFLHIAWPAYGYELDPRGGPGFVEVSRTGKIFGMEARMAAEYGGYHKAAAGTTAVLDGDKGDRMEGADLNEGLLNRYGLQPVKKYGADYIVWGDRAPFENQEWTWKHQREQMSYYENVLAVSYDWLIFAITTLRLRTMSIPHWPSSSSSAGRTVNCGATSSPMPARSRLTMRTTPMPPGQPVN